MRKVGWFDIYVEDMDRAQAFYETVLVTTLSPMDDPNDPTGQMRAFGDDFTSHGAGGALVKLAFAQPGPGGSGRVARWSTSPARIAPSRKLGCLPPEARSYGRSSRSANTASSPSSPTPRAT